MTQIDTDRIEKQMVLRAPRSRVWRALTNVEEFNTWFGVALTGSFAPGANLAGPVMHEGYQHLTMDVTIDRMEPERLMAWRWHPGSTEAGVDYSQEPPTHVTFELKDVPEGTLLTVVETGFDALPPGRRSEAYRGNDDGWTGQMQAIEKHLEQFP